MARNRSKTRFMTKTFRCNSEGIQLFLPQHPLSSLFHLLHLNIIFLEMLSIRLNLAPFHKDLQDIGSSDSEERLNYPWNQKFVLVLSITLIIKIKWTRTYLLIITDFKNSWSSDFPHLTIQHLTILSHWLWYCYAIPDFSSFLTSYIQPTIKFCWLYPQIYRIIPTSHKSGSP